MRINILNQHLFIKNLYAVTSKLNPENYPLKDS